MGAPRLSKLNLAILVLASGRGERFLASGGKTHKLDAPFVNGRTVLEATVHAARSTGLIVHVERSAHAGMGDTIAAAVAATQDADGWLMLPADMPLVTPEIMLMVAAELANELNTAPITAPVLHGVRGHPVGFSKACLNDLLALSGDAGAKSLFQKLGLKKINVDKQPFASGCLIDIDTVEDLQKAQALVIYPR